uniref:Uncharacterized protein n=1 Tax=Arundo donax TaxID=35708 RepID=A0A0A8YEQ0_ARUDO
MLWPASVRDKGLA